MSELRGAPPGEPPGSAAGAPAAEPLLRVRDLRVAFKDEEGERVVVDGVGLDVGAGEAVGLVGESGCGKSVTALSLLRLLPAASARTRPGSSIRFRGEELLDAPSRRIREIRGGGIAMVFQEPMTSLNPVLTVGEQVAEAARLHAGLRGAGLRARVVELLERVGIPDPASRAGAYPHQLSGGMRQRAMIAMALAGEPDLLVADEPTTALDVTIQAQILALLRKLREEMGLALLLISHDLAVVSEVTDRVSVMYAGQIVEEGTVPGLFEAPAHPYTRGLLASIPDPDRPGRRLRAIPGTVPPPGAWPAGCRFRPRCPHAWERCADDPPTLLETGGGRARCWLVEEPERAVEAAP